MNVENMTEGERKARFTGMLVSYGLDPVCAEACTRALSWRGKNGGFLKRTKPSGNDLAAGAWCALMLEANPLKVGAGGLMMLSDDARAVYREVAAAIDDGKLGGNFWKLDRDRVQLEALGVY